MSETRVCPNDGFIKDIFSYTEKVRDSIVPGLDSAVEMAADANKLAASEPLAALEWPVSPQEATDMAITWASNAEKIKELADRGGKIINSPCPGAQACAKVCIKMAVAMESVDTIREMAKPFIED